MTPELIAKEPATPVQPVPVKGRRLGQVVSHAHRDAIAGAGPNCRPEVSTIDTNRRRRKTWQEPRIPGRDTKLINFVDAGRGFDQLWNLERISLSCSRPGAKRKSGIQCHP